MTSINSEVATEPYNSTNTGFGGRGRARRQASKVISDQYGAITIVTTDGRVVTGRIGNMNGNSINIVEDMFNAGRLTGISRDDVESIQPSSISMMPEGLLNTLTAEEIQDLVAYLYSRGSPDHEMFQQAASN